MSPSCLRSDFILQHYWWRLNEGMCTSMHVLPLTEDVTSRCSARGGSFQQKSVVRSKPTPDDRILHGVRSALSSHCWAQDPAGPRHSDHSQGAQAQAVMPGSRRREARGRGTCCPLSTEQGKFAGERWRCWQLGDPCSSRQG